MAQTQQPSVASLFNDLGTALAQDDNFHIDAAKLELSEQIFEALANQGLTEAEFARRLGVSRAYVNKILQGNVNFTIATLVKISRVLNHKFEFQMVPENGITDVLDAKIIYTEDVALPEISQPHRGARKGAILEPQNYTWQTIPAGAPIPSETWPKLLSEENYVYSKNAA